MSKKMMVIAICIVGLAVAAQAFGQAKPLTDEQKMMMKNMAMKNMDKYMGDMSLIPDAAGKAQMGHAEWGKKLFNDKGLSTNGQSCNDCHPGGGTVGGTVDTPMPSEVTGKPYSIPVPTLVGAAATFPKWKVPNDRVVNIQEMTNNCIMMFMAAQPLALDSDESKALAAYLATLSEGTEMEPGKMPKMMM